MSCEICDPNLDRTQTFSSQSAFLAELSRVEGDLETGRASRVGDEPFGAIFDCAACMQRWELVFPDWPQPGWLRKAHAENARLEELRAKFRDRER